MAISDKYRAQLLEVELLEAIKNGVVPTSEELETALNERLGSHTDLSIPFSADHVGILKQYDSASAEVFNSANNAFKTDIDFLYQTTISLIKDGMSTFDKWRMRGDLEYQRLLNLDTRISALLLLNEDTAGFFSFIEDNLTDLSKVDTIRTNAEVDPVNNHVIIKRNRGVSDGRNTFVKHNLNKIQNTDVSFFLLTKADVVSSSPISKSERRFIFMDETLVWQHQVISKRQDKQIVGQLTAKLFSESKKATRIDLQMHSPNTTSKTTVIVQYSRDGKNFFALPIKTGIRTIDNSTSFIFPEIELQYIRLILKKASHDAVSSGAYLYHFGIKQLKLFNYSYKTLSSEGGTLISKQLDTPATKGGLIQFNKCSLEVCEDIPDDTSIQYYVSVQENPTTEEDWQIIDPFNRDITLNPTVVQFSSTREFEADAGIDTGVTDVGDLKVNNTLGLPLNNDPNNRLLNASIDAIITSPSQGDENLENNSIVLWRNVGTSLGVTGSFNLESFKTVRGVDIGWGYDGTFYSTNFEVQEDIEIDFGEDKEALLDDVRVTGVTTIKRGIHKFKTHKLNWKRLSPGPAYSVEADFVARDSIFPYNHKLLIEGFKYDFGYLGLKPYLGVDRFAEFRMTRVSKFDLFNNVADDDYSRFATTFDNSGNLVFVLKIDTRFDTSGDESFKVTYNTTSELFEKIRLRAILKSERSDLSPMLESYRIKLGI